MSAYFETIDSGVKAYLLGLIAFNIHNVKNSEVIVELNGRIPPVIEELLKNIEIDVDNNSNLITIKSQDTIEHICKHLGLQDINLFYNIQIFHFVKNNDREYVIEFLKAFYEKYGGITTGVCNVTTNIKANLTTFAEFFGIPYRTSNIFNLSKISYTGANVIDLLGIIYKNPVFYVNDNLYLQFLQLLNMERPTLKYVKMCEQAVTPTKANYSDVGYDITVIGEHKKLCGSTSLYKTGIKLDIPLGYYVELAPRSSLSKSGYMLANSIGIIDCSYTGELLVALAKIDGDAPAIEYPFRCCQLIMRKQIFPDMVELKAEELGSTVRGDGGFGST
jgi:deoxyuridine 5'-triphosphate nucleotidohydrolase